MDDQQEARARIAPFPAKTPAEAPEEFIGIPARDPNTGKQIELFLWKPYLNHERFKGRRSRNEMADTVQHAVLLPCSIHEGLRRVSDGDGKWCYASLPEYRWWGEENTPEQVTRPDDRIFLVFVSEDRVIYNVRWEARDPKDGNCPRTEPGRDGECRFDRRLL